MSHDFFFFYGMIRRDYQYSLCRSIGKRTDSLRTMIQQISREVSVNIYNSIHVETPGTPIALFHFRQEVKVCLSIVSLASMKTNPLPDPVGTDRDFGTSFSLRFLFRCVSCNC